MQTGLCRFYSITVFSLHAKTKCEGEPRLCGSGTGDGNRCFGDDTFHFANHHCTSAERNGDGPGMEPLTIFLLLLQSNISTVCVGWIQLASNVLSESKEETSEILITLVKPIPATAQIFSLSLAKKAHELTTEKRKADKLLLQMLPPTVARQV